VLIHLDGSAVADATSGSPTASRSHACIENLLLAHFEGNHVVSLLPGDAALLRDAAPGWSARARRGLDHIDENYAQISGLRADIRWSLELGLGAEFDGKAHDAPGGTRIIRAPLHVFEKSHTLSFSTLLGESLTDADFFQQLGDLRRAERRWDGVEIVHETRGAGGSTFAPEYERLAAKGRILLAIADSDMRHPGSGVGGTLHRLQTRAGQHPDYQRARPLPTRTAEGLVPLDVYREALESLHGHGDQRLAALDRLKPFLRSAPSDITRYAHLKDGLRLYQIENPKTAAEGAYWRKIATNAGRDRCTWATTEQCTKKEECKCYVVDALGANALCDVVLWMKTKKSKRSLASRFDLARNTPLADLADEVVAWGLALPPVLT
jgi:signal transduction histidine kinase